MHDPVVKKTATVVLVGLLVTMSILVLKPIFISIVIALILAFIFTPVFDFINKYINSRNASAGVIVLFVLLLIILPIWFLTPILLNQSFSLFQAAQQIDFVKPLKSVFPSLFASQQFSSEIGSVLSSFTSKVASDLMNSISMVILDFPNLALQFTVIFFTFFFVLRDQEVIVEYVKSLLPFSKDVEKKLFDNSKLLTSAILYGQVIIGIIQGVILGIGLFIFGVKNALILTLFAALAGILPILGTAIVWLPVAVYLFVAGNTVPAWGVVVFGVLSSTVDNTLRPIIVSRRTKIHSGILVVSMIGGIFLFGIMGFILGPLIVSYLLIILEIYRGKPTPGVIMTEKSK
ncbi:MAG: AI-2E family transporter [Nanoarchaeota archaeon]